MADTESAWICPLCSVNTTSKHELSHHICTHHLGYRKYQCNSCSELFYTEEEREAHCRRKSHVHTFEVKVSRYCELYVSQIVKDAEWSRLYGLDAVIQQRSKASLACDLAMNKLQKAASGVKRGIETPPVDHSSPRTDTPKTEPSRRKTTSMTKDGNGEESPSTAKKQPHGKGIERMPPDDWTRIELDNTPKPSSASHLIDEKLRTTPPQERCRLCNKLTSYDYVLRKDHVSSEHLPKDHTEADFVEILCEKMKKAYPTLSYSDLQCQLGGCYKEIRSQTARRYHVLHCHFKNQLDCPINCGFSSNEFPVVNNHLKTDHDLRNGHNSIEDQQVRNRFKKQQQQHNVMLSNLIQEAFPCPVPECYKTNAQSSADRSEGETVQSLIVKLSQSSRKFQRPPPNPLRRRSPSSGSESDSSRPNESSSIQKSQNDDGSKTMETQESSALAKASESSATSSSSSSSSGDDELDREMSKASSAKKRSKHLKESSLQNNLLSENETAAKRKRMVSEESSSSSSSSQETSEKTSTPPPSAGVRAANESTRTESAKKHHVQSSSSASSTSSSDTEDDIQVVKLERTPQKAAKAAKVTTPEAPIPEPVLQDSDEDCVAYWVPSRDPAEKQPKVKTLAISGVTVRIDGHRASSDRSIRSAPPADRPTKRLAISGVCVPLDSTPVSKRKRFSRHLSTQEVSEQVQKRRQKAQWKSETAVKRQQERSSRSNNRGASAKGVQRSKSESVHNRERFTRRMKEAQPPPQNATPSRSSLSAAKGKPSYVVQRVKQEFTSSPPYGHKNSWKGTFKRFSS